MKYMTHLQKKEKKTYEALFKAKCFKLLKAAHYGTAKLPKEKVESRR